MGDCNIIYREIRFVIEDDLTQVYVAIEAQGDCPFGVQGWHHKTFSDKYSTYDLMKMWRDNDAVFGDPVLWSMEAPAE